MFFSASLRLQQITTSKKMSLVEKICTKITFACCVAVVLDLLVVITEPISLLTEK